MPYSFHVFKSLQGAGLPFREAEAIAGVVESAKLPEIPRPVYESTQIMDALRRAGIADQLAVALCSTLQNCFWSERFNTHFDQGSHRTELEKAGFAQRQAEVFLAALTPAVVTPHPGEIRRPVSYPPRAGAVVMCDFDYLLLRDEMTKRRRTIVISRRSKRDRQRSCVVVPVSMNPRHHAKRPHVEFPAGRYRFFHPHNPVWAICDHLHTVALERLWQVNLDHRPQIPNISDADLREVQTRVAVALGLGP
jgi:uncharacterized protein YifN (PemK superfamily)